MEAIFFQIGVQIGLAIGQITILIIIIKSIKEEIQKQIETQNRRTEKIEEELYNFKGEIYQNYLRKDEWLAFNNKFEAEVKILLKEIKDEIRRMRDE